MTKNVTIGVVAVVFCAGAYLQEVKAGRERSQDLAQPPVARRVCLALAGLCGKSLPIKQALIDRQADLSSAACETNAIRPALPAAPSARVEAVAAAEPPLVNHSQTQGVGKVVVILGSSPTNSAPQKFMVRLASGKMLLIEHNTEVARPVEKLALGDEIAFCGEYSRGIDGDMIRWTHKAPAAGHFDGWIRHNGRIYQ